MPTPSPDRPRRRHRLRAALRRPTLGTMLGALALFVALGGQTALRSVAADAASLINGSQLKPGSVTGAKLKNGTISASKLSASVRSKLGTGGAAGGVGPAGPVGPTGATGATGPAGPKGETGPKGDTGPSGAAAAKGDKGDVGPAGPKGDTGATGPKGDVGPAGPATQATLADGSVSTAKLADVAVTAQKLAPLSVDASKLSGPIPTSKITNLSTTQDVDVPTVPARTCVYSAAKILGFFYNLKDNALIATPTYASTSTSISYSPEIDADGLLRMKACNVTDNAVPPKTVTFNFVAFPKN